ncbi:hypothetical protein [Fodinicola feengrottensis]|uniref:VOC domain-containing protein n=1 Tax=Fodinicola feengrottensis TaxID=435914 RepID=A0ABP4SIV8_9ACTN|nr:hypothetical protein [Fodinicola feengrottensis]
MSNARAAVAGISPLRAVTFGQPLCVWAREITTALDFYLAIGCEVRKVADGRVYLHNNNTRFILAYSPGPVAASVAQTLQVTTVDLAEVCCRLYELGIEAGPITYPAAAPHGRIELCDPDRHVVVVIQLPASGDTRVSPARHSPSAHDAGGHRTAVRRA